MNKKILKVMAVFALSSVLLTGCSGKKGKKPEKTTAESETTTEATTSETETKPTEPAPPGGAAYAWLGLSEMPKCKYLDALAASHYTRKFTHLSMGYVTEVTEVCDCVNMFIDYGGNTRSYSVDGKGTWVNDVAKQWGEREDNASNSDAAAQRKKDIEAGENIKKRVFVTTGKGAVPLYSEHYDDNTELEYYEYKDPTQEQFDVYKTERFYMKDGDVFAVYTETKIFDETTRAVEVIRSVSPDVDQNAFKVTGVDDYKKSE